MVFADIIHFRALCPSILSSWHIALHNHQSADFITRKFKLLNVFFTTLIDLKQPNKNYLSTALCDKVNFPY